MSITSAAASPAATRPKFYFVPEVARELRCSEASVRWLLHQGRIKSAKLNGRRVIKPEWLDEYINNALKEAS